MIKGFFSIILFYFALACTSNERHANCSEYKIGKFKYYSKVNGNFYIIERNDSIQVERNLTTGSITTLKINWTNDCEYELRYISRQSSPNDSIINIATKTVLKTKIVEVGKDFCIFSSQAPGMDKILTDTLKLWNTHNL